MTAGGKRHRHGHTQKSLPKLGASMLLLVVVVVVVEVFAAVGTKEEEEERGGGGAVEVLLSPPSMDEITAAACWWVGIGCNGGNKAGAADKNMRGLYLFCVVVLVVLVCDECKCVFNVFWKQYTYIYLPSPTLVGRNIHYYIVPW